MRLIHTHTHTHTATAIGCRARHWPARQEQSGLGILLREPSTHPGGIEPATLWLPNDSAHLLSQEGWERDQTTRAREQRTRWFRIEINALLFINVFHQKLVFSPHFTVKVLQQKHIVGVTLVGLGDSWDQGVSSVIKQLNCSLWLGSLGIGSDFQTEN